MSGCALRVIIISIIVFAIVSFAVNNSDNIKNGIKQSQLFTETFGKFIKYKK